MTADNLEEKEKKITENVKELEDQLKEGKRAMRWLLYGILCGIGSVILYSFQGDTFNEVCAISSVGIIASGASLLAGGVLGFLFGIPKTLQEEVSASKPSENQQSDQEQEKDPYLKYRTNTNLEQISDWLTKMLVGVGLTQLYIIPGKLQQLIEYLGKGLVDSPYNQAFALAVLMYFIAIGFLFGYLWTRLFFTRALLEADRKAIDLITKKFEQTGKEIEQFKKQQDLEKAALQKEYENATQKIEQADKEIEQFRKQPDLDAEALSLTFKQLFPSRGEPTIAQEELDSAIASSSDSTKVQIFNQAAQLRSKTWKEASTKHEMERTIPIFRALISCDPENKFHKNHGQLGFALKDKPESNWAEAEQELTKAIDIRGDWKKYGWLFYEFNRAYCRIMQDSAFKKKQPSDKAMTKDIRNDLKTASNAEYIRYIIENDPVVQEWIQINKIRI